LFSAGFQLVLQACLALFDLINFLHLIKKKKERALSQERALNRQKS
jgi:hypothetical protein